MPVCPLEPDYDVVVLGAPRVQDSVCDQLAGDQHQIPHDPADGLQAVEGPSRRRGGGLITADCQIDQAQGSFE